MSADSLTDEQYDIADRISEYLGAREDRDYNASQLARVAGCTTPVVHPVLSWMIKHHEIGVHRSRRQLDPVPRASPRRAERARVMTAAELRAKLATAESELAGIGNVGVDDIAATRLNSQTLGQVYKHYDSGLARFVEQSRRVENLRALLRSAEAREAEAQRVRLTVEQVRGARLVRDRHGWHKVVRVSAKTVTVETGFSWTERIPLEKIHEISATDREVA